MNTFSKCIFIVTTFIACKTSDINNDTNIQDNYRSKAIELITSSSYAKEYSIKKNNIRVSNELISFSDIGFFFMDSLQQYGFHELEFAYLEHEIKIDPYLNNLSTKKNAKVQLFFSDEKKDIFFIELFIERRSQIKYNEISDFGFSLAFMFKKIKGRVELLKASILHYN